MPGSDMHIVTFAVPFPARYGGAIDVWHRISALQAKGVRIQLHCFVYDSFTPQPELQEVASQVHYYPRVIWPALFEAGQPYIVTSRKSRELLNRLSLDRLPILFEGIHTTGFVSELHDRVLLLRSHNIEHEYYTELADRTQGMRSLIYRRESLCLADYEKDIARSFDAVLAISPHDQEWYAHRGAKAVLLPPFHGEETIDVPSGRGTYILYQGDLSLEINQHAVLHLLRQLQSVAEIPIVIAGRSGSKEFEDRLLVHPNLKRYADVSPENMKAIIQDAQVILVHSLHGSGMKIKFFPALYHGRFVAATRCSQTDTGLDQAIQWYEPDAVADVIQSLWPTEFSESRIKERVDILSGLPGDMEKAGEIIRYL